MKPVKQMELLESVLEMKKKPAKRVNIVSLKLVKESSLLYKDRCVRSPEDGYQLLKKFLGDVDREYFVVV
jgi:predicted site-specific integrase-resolvase